VSWEKDIFAGQQVPESEFKGYETLSLDANITALAAGGQVTGSALEGDKVAVVLNKTPFYAEMGGQVGDTGYIRTQDGTGEIRVLDCKKAPEGYFVHTGEVTKGMIQIGDYVTAEVDPDVRHAIMRNHTSAHLLQAALRQVLGNHVHQAGAYYDSHRTRFDFMHYQAMTPEEIKKTEDLVNSWIMQDIPVKIEEMKKEDAEKLGAMALFGEKYGDIVRVVEIGDVSKEFCGGTHVARTSELGLFKIISEGSTAAGVRRIESTTGFGVLEYLGHQEKILADAAGALRLSGSFDQIPGRIESLEAEVKELKRQVESDKSRKAGEEADSLLRGKVNVDGVNVYAARINAPQETLRSISDSIRDRDANSVVLLFGRNNDRNILICACGKEAVEHGFTANKIIKKVASRLGGSGGGKPDFSQGGFKDDSSVEVVISDIGKFIKESES
ncbi:MAG: alanine--tRNA ligase-related protein, partial [Oscillospiraceae bacterium]